MALLNVNAARIGSAIGNRVTSRLLQRATAAITPKLVQDVQGVLGKSRMVANLLGIRTGTALDSMLGLGAADDVESRLFGGLTLQQVQKMHSLDASLHRSMRNLYFVRVLDLNPPDVRYPSRDAESSGDGGIISRIGSMVGSVASGITSAASTVAGAAAGRLVGGAMSGAMATLGLGGTLPADSVAAGAGACFDMLCLDASYTDAITGDSVALGTTFYDAPQGAQQIELSLTLHDDEVGTIKRWFEGKRLQVASPDGTVGLPAHFCVAIEIVHAVPSADAKGAMRGYSKFLNLRAASCAVELSRREAGFEELSLTFAQIDPFMG